jgi:hypothetical protein
LDAEKQALVDGRRRHEDGVWLILQEIVAAAGNAGKLLWGVQGKKTEAERTPLRGLAKVSPRSPLRSRNVRNSFEHFDERIEEWHQAGETDAYSSRLIGQQEFPPRRSRFGQWDPKFGVVIFGEDSISITNVLAELDRIHPNLGAPQRSACYGAGSLTFNRSASTRSTFATTRRPLAITAGSFPTNAPRQASGGGLRAHILAISSLLQLMRLPYLAAARAPASLSPPPREPPH